jgi:Holliday junction DNA helicase RuvA
MIVYLTGKLFAIGKRFVVVQVGGVGLRVHVPDSFTARCGPVGSTVSLHTHLHVREDELALYGCATEDELHLFELLLSVSGVGPKAALSMLSALSGDEIRGAIATEQASTLSSVPGIGAKTAKKIILDLKDKVQVTGEMALPASPITELDGEVIAALTTLGYSVIESQTALQHVPADVQDIEGRLRAALTYLGQ